MMKKKIKTYFPYTIFAIALLLCVVTSPILYAQTTTTPTSTADSLFIHKKIKDATKLKHTNPDTAIVVLNNIYHLSIEKKQYSGTIIALIELSNVYMQTGDYTLAQNSLNSATKYVKTPYQKSLYAAIYNNLGNVYSYKAQYDSAVDYYIKALDYKKKNIDIKPNQQPPISYIYNNIAFSHLELGNTEQAALYLQETKKAAEAANDTNLLANNMGNIASLHLTLHQFDSAIIAYHSSVTYALSNHNQSALFRGFTGIGSAYLKLEQADSALHYFMWAYQLYNSASIEKNGYNTLLCNIGSLYSEKKEYKNAIYYFQLVAADSHKTPKETALLYIRMATHFAQMGNYKKAYEFQTLSHTLTDSIKSIDISVKINDLESRYELSQKNTALSQSEALLAAQQVQTQKRNWWIIVLSLLVTSIIILSYIWQKLQQKRQKAEQTILSLNAKIEGEEMEKKRIAHDLHDGVNSHIAAAKSFLMSTEKHHPQLSHSESFSNAMTLLNTTASEVRNIAHNLAPDILLNDGLNVALALFCNNAFSKTNVTHHLHTAGNLQMLHPSLSLNVYRIIQELCNNILKHAQATTVTILLTLEDKLLNITVEDNGKGFKPDEQHLGIGLKSVHNRVHILGGQLQIDSEEHSHTAVYITINIENYTNEHKSSNSR